MKIYIVKYIYCNSSIKKTFFILNCSYLIPVKRPSSSFVSPPNSSKKKREETPDTNKNASNHQNSSSKKSTTAPSQRMQVIFLT